MGRAAIVALIVLLMAGTELPHISHHEHRVVPASALYLL